MPAPVPGWAIEADVIVVGSGVAGLTAALRCAAAGRRTVVVTKARLDDGSTRWAQGGIAAALGTDDSPEQHLADTLVAGAGLCDEDAVRVLVDEGPDAVRRLIDTGARFDTSPDTGELALTREGGHHRSRIAHAGGDATGAEISRALVRAVRTHGIRTVENALALDLLRAPDGRAAGVSLHVMGEGRQDGVGAVRAPAVVLATGGMGQIFSATTNPAVSTGDGVALALRAGARASDLEFVQFHPTVLYLGEAAEGQQPLVSEAVRGEGAHLVDADGMRFLLGQHELAELAPRDVVAKAITRRMRETGAAHVYLDARHFGASMWARRFPTILAACRAHGIDPVTEPIPVVPAAHYASGGIRTDLHGRTTVPGLYACGEVACTGVHGANRLASNSLLEGLVFAERIARHITQRVGPTEPGEPAEPGTSPEDQRRADPPQQPPAYAPAPAYAPEPAVLLPAHLRAELQRAMTEGAGVLRTGQSLARTADRLAELAALTAGPSDGGRRAEPGVDAWETSNLHLVARVLVTAALRRTETRGCHWREDHPERDDTEWGRHLILGLRPDQDSRTLDALETRTTEGTSLPPIGTSDAPPEVPPRGPGMPATSGRPAPSGSPAVHTPARDRSPATAREENA
ncbi:L-aspartate oxidase [Streptomyces oceani]|uniref:L-aspartate oxidase n=1 Tax=Streptomyces oceani TaxID=1075402 RepID=UPI0009A0D81F|nr:L-aspartate oxidase [Streptomyces oceani]